MIRTATNALAVTKKSPANAGALVSGDYSVNVSNVRRAVDSIFLGVELTFCLLICAI